MEDDASTLLQRGKQLWWELVGQTKIPFDQIVNKLLLQVEGKLDQIRGELGQIGLP